MMVNILTLILGAWALLAVSGEGGYQPGDKARDFKLKNVDGTYVSMAGSPANKGYIIIFTCNTCPYSVAYEDRIIALHNRYAPMGYPVIAINPNDPGVQPGDSFAMMQVRAREKGFPFPYVFDEAQEVTLAYGASNTPHVYVVEKVAEYFVVRYTGAIDNNTKDANKVTKRYVEAAVNSLLAGEAVQTTTTKAIGCTIKWSAASKQKRGQG